MRVLGRRYTDWRREGPLSQSEQRASGGEESTAEAGGIARTDVHKCVDDCSWHRSRKLASRRGSWSHEKVAKSVTSTIKRIMSNVIRLHRCDLYLWQYSSTDNAKLHAHKRYTSSKAQRRPMA